MRSEVVHESVVITNVETGDRGPGTGDQGPGTGDRGTGTKERGTGNGERGTGNGEPGTGVWERVYSGNPPNNSKWRTKENKREQFGKI